MSLHVYLGTATPRLWHGQMSDHEQRVMLAVEREREHWRRSVEFWMRIARLQRRLDELRRMEERRDG